MNQASISDFRRTLRLKQVIQVVGLSRIYCLMNQGIFPKSVKIGVSAVGWNVEQIDSWVAERNAGVNGMSAFSINPTRVNARKRLGECYRLAMMGLLDHPTDEWLLVHGEARGQDGSRLGHAWLLHQASEICYDPVTDCCTPESDYLRKYETKPIVKYSRKSAAILMNKARHFGPWHEGAV